MFELLKKKLFDKIKPEETKGLFLSVFDEKNNLLSSQGLLETDRPASQLIETLYNSVVLPLKNPKRIICDIVSDFHEESDTQKILNTSMKEYGIFVESLDGSKSGIILPDTVWVPDVKTALFMIKQKYQVGGQMKIFLVRTIRISVSW